jgi:general secretion pathway protein J
MFSFHSKSTYRPLAFKEKGFTLIEVLLSLVFLTIVLGAVYSSFFTVQRALERFDGVSLKYHEARTSLDALSREIEGAFLDTSQALNSDKNTTSFELKDRDIRGNSASRLSFNAFSFRGSGTKKVSYFVDEKDGSLILFKSESYLYSSVKDMAKPGSPQKTYTVELIEGIRSFTIETLFQDEWIRTWDSRNTGALPGVVRVSIEIPDRGGNVVLTEYARPRIGSHL